MVDEKKRNQEIDENPEEADEGSDLVAAQGKSKTKDPDQEIAEFIKQARTKDENGLQALFGSAAFASLIQTAQSEKGKVKEAPPGKDDLKAAKAENRSEKTAEKKELDSTRKPTLADLDTVYKKTVADAKGRLEKMSTQELRLEEAQPDVKTQWQRHSVDILQTMAPAFGKLPKQEGPVDLETVREKLGKNQIDKLSKEELTVAVKLEAIQGKFGPASELAQNLANAWFNQYALGVYKDTVASGLRMRPGGPISNFEIDSDQKNPFGMTPEAFKYQLLQDKFQLQDLKAASDKGLVKTTLNLDASIKPGIEELLRFENSKAWVDTESNRLAENTNQIEANRRYQVISEFLGIKDQGWKPPEDPNQLLAYCQRADEVCNLMLRVRNYAEVLNSLEQIDGGKFQHHALKEDFPGKISWDESGKRISKLELDLPSSLDCSPEGERKLQKLQAWLDRFGPQVDQVLADYKAGAPLRYGDFMEAGVVRSNKDGGVLAVQDKAGETHVLMVDGKPVTRNLDGVLRDRSGKVVEVPGSISSAMQKEFDYIGDKFSVSKDSKTGEILIDIDRSFEKDHFINYNRWFGSVVGNIQDTRRYRPDELVSVQTSSGVPQLVRADRLAEFQAIQSLWHHGGKVATCAMDVGMVVSGSVGARAAFQAGKTLYVATNLTRAALGLGGLLDPSFRQMGELGEGMRKARHAAILLDVTSGLLRQSPALVGSSKVLFESASAMEVSKAIEASATMSRLHSATTKVFAVCDAIYLPMMTNDIIDKARLNMGYNPQQLLEDARIQVGKGRDEIEKKQRTPEDLKQGRREMLSVYEKFMDTKPEKRAAVTDIFDKTREFIDSEKAEEFKKTKLAAYYLPTGGQLQVLKEANSDSIPKFKSDVEIKGPFEEKVAAAIGLLQLSTKDGKFPADGVLMKRTVDVPGYDRVSYDSEGNEHRTPIAPEENLPQQITIKDVLATLNDAALNADSPATRAVAADALYRTGAMGAGKYARIMLEHLEKDPSSPENKEKRLQMLMQVANLIETARISEAVPPQDPVARRFAQAESFGASSRELIRSMQELASKETNPDLRAMSMAILYSLEQKNPQKKLDEYTALYRKLADQPGEFRNAVINGFKQELNTPIPENNITERDAAIAARLSAVKAFRNFEGSKLEEKTFQELNIEKKLSECLPGSKLKDNYGKGSLDLSIAVIDSMMSRKDTLSIQERHMIAATASAIMAIPFPKDGTGRTEPAVAKLAVIARMKQIYELSEPRDLSSGAAINKGPMTSALKDILSTDIPGAIPTSGWGQYPEMRVAAITGLKSLGLAEKDTLNLITKYLDYDPSKSGPEAFLEKNPLVRSAAYDALYSLAEYKMRYSAADLEQIKNNDKAKPLVQGLEIDPKLYVDELLKREREPAALETLRRVYTRKDRMDPESPQYNEAFNLETERLNSAELISVNQNMVLNFVGKHPHLKLLDHKYFEGEMKRTAEQKRTDPYGGFWGWCESWVDSRATIRSKTEEATRSANSYAYQEKNKERREALTALSRLGDIPKEDQDMAIKSLMFIIRNPKVEIFPGGDLSYACVRSSELLMRLCQAEANQDVVGNKQLLSKAVVSCLLDSSIDLDPQVKHNLLKCVDSLTFKDPAKSAEAFKRDFALFTPERAAMVYQRVLEREKQVFESSDKLQAGDHQASRAIQFECLQKIYELRGHSAEPKLDAMCTNSGLKKNCPDLAQSAGEVLAALRYGVMHLQKDVPADRGTSLSARADYMEAGLNDAKFNYEGACLSLFRAFKDKPIERPKIAGAEDQEDPRLKPLLTALSHENERVRLSAALILADSKVDSHFIRACNTLADLAANGSKQRYQQDAASLLKDIIQRGQPAEQDIAYSAWKAAYDANQAIPKELRKNSSAPELPLTIAKPEELAVRKVSASELDRIIANGRAPETAAEKKAKEDYRIRHLSVISGMSEEAIREKLEPPSSSKIDASALRLSVPCTSCHALMRAQESRSLSNSDSYTYLSKYPNLDLKTQKLSRNFLEQSQGTDKQRQEETKAMIAALLAEKIAEKPEPIEPETWTPPGWSRENALLDLEARYKVQPFVTERLSIGKPEIGRPVWGQVRHRLSDSLAGDAKVTDNTNLAASFLETKLPLATSNEERIQAIKDACNRTPLLAASDRRIGKIVDFLKDNDPALRQTAAELILRSRNGAFLNSGFNTEHRIKAYEVLSSISTNTSRPEDKAELQKKTDAAGELLIKELSVVDADKKLALCTTLLNSGLSSRNANEQKSAVFKELVALAANNELAPQLRLRSAELFMKAGAPQQELLSKSVLELTQHGDTSSAARELLQKFDKTASFSCMVNLRTSLASSKLNPEQRSKQIELALMLGEKWKQEPRFEAALYDLKESVLKANDPKLLSRLSSMLDRSNSDSLSPLNGKDDPRYAAMLKHLDSKDTDAFQLNAALALSDPKAGEIPADVAEIARVKIYQAVEKQLENLNSLESSKQKAKDEDWSKLDSLLEKIGQSKDDYSRLYIESKRLSLKEDHRALGEVYGKLAQISSERGSQNAAQLYRQRSQEERELSDPEIQNQLKQFEQMLTSIKPDEEGNRTKISDALQQLQSRTGENSRLLANAYYKLSEYYCAAKNFTGADEASQKATQILHQLASSTSTSLSPGAGSSNNNASTRNLAVSDWEPSGDKVSLKSNSTLSDMLDYKFSMAVVGQESKQKARELAEASLKANESIFGADSPNTVQSKESLADLLSKLGDGNAANEHYQQILQSPWSMGENRARLTLKLSTGLINQGPEGHQKAVELLEDSLQKMQMEGLAPNQIAAKMLDYAKLMKQRGDGGKAQDLINRSQQLNETGILPPSRNAGFYRGFGAGGNTGPGPDFGPGGNFGPGDTPQS